MSIERPAYVTTFIGKRLDEFDKKCNSKHNFNIVHTCIIERFELKHPYYLRKELYQMLYQERLLEETITFSVCI